MIEAGEAHIWWNEGQGQVRVHRYGSGADEQTARAASPHDTAWSDIGACESSWCEIDDAARVRLMLETAIDLMVEGSFEPAAVVREFAKVRQFRELGSASYPMCRAISKAETGRASDDLDAVMAGYDDPDESRHTPG